MTLTIPRLPMPLNSEKDARGRLVWGEAEEEFLRQFYPVHGEDWCARRLGITRAAVSCKASELRLRVDLSTPEWNRRAKARVQGRPPMSEEARRRLSEASRRHLATFGHPRGMLGKRHTAETRAAISRSGKGRPVIRTEAGTESIRRSASARMIERLREGPEGVYSRSRRGWRVIAGRRIFFRSRWEANYARFLEWLRGRAEILSWDYEPKTFWFESIRRGCRSYTPDFQVRSESGEEWHEVKGWMDPKSRVKLERMARHHPAERVVLVDAARYREIERKLGGVVPGWE